MYSKILKMIFADREFDVCLYNILQYKELERLSLKVGGRLSKRGVLLDF